MTADDIAPQPSGGTWPDRVIELVNEANRAHLVALRATGSHALAEEAVQEAYARIIERPPQDLGRAPVTAYFLKMVRGIAINSLKSSMSRKRRETKVMRRVTTATSVEEVHTARETLQAAKKALDTLPSNEREAVSLRCEQGFELSLVAQVLNVPVQTVHDRVRRGLDKLRSVLTNTGYAAHAPNDLGEALRASTTTGDWSVVRFGEFARPVAESDWDTELGEWELVDGEWVSRGRTENILVWNMDVPGSFRYICEGWLETEGELSLIGHRASSDSKRFEMYSGYHFEFGAEFNTCTKLARHRHDVVSKIGLAVEPGRRYRLKMEYLDREGLLHCYIDDKRVFAYREMFTFPGTRLGFYAWGKGAHLKPIEVERQNWGIDIPPMRAADRQYQYGNYREALKSYRQVAEDEAAPQDALEARLKMGMCLALLRSREKSRASFAMVKGTNMEPFAVAEEAASYCASTNMDDRRTALELFSVLMDKHGSSHAKVRVLDACESMRRDQPIVGDSLQDDLEIRAEFERLGRETMHPPTRSQLGCQVTRSALLMRCGKWREALDDMLAFIKTMSPSQLWTMNFRAVYATVAMSAGRDDLLPESVFDIPDWGTQIDEHAGTAFHCIVRKGGAPQFITEVVENGRVPLRHTSDAHEVQFALFLARLAAERIDEALSMVDSMDPANTSVLHGVGSALVEARMKDALEAWFARADRATGDDEHAHTLCVLRSRWNLENGRLDEAAALLSRLPPLPEWRERHEGYLMQALLSSLGVNGSARLESFAGEYRRRVAGTELELMEMFMHRRDARPTNTWPHELWRPEWRLWLALWLEAKGDRAGVLDVLSPSRDERYGLTHSQPAIREVLSRNSKRKGKRAQD